jgi:hypothetical protein
LLFLLLFLILFLVLLLFFPFPFFLRLRFQSLAFCGRLLSLGRIYGLSRCLCRRLLLGLLLCCLLRFKRLEDIRLSKVITT